ncbi:MAG: DUF1385 domain-containing protein [Oscillospiraceae bacterium]|nr:DUF1385 domain-containing protein [Ruminococcus sp.]MBQ4346041.1 DUF1385 domain-containing protein [Oscillospiraceae bacterium]
MNDTPAQQPADAQQAARAEYAYKSKIGGQALVEGIMMKGAFRGAMACRLPNGEIDLETWEIPVKLQTDPKTGKVRPVLPWYRRIPLVRGSVNFVTQMIDGYRCMMRSAEKQVDEELDAFVIWKKKQKLDKLPQEEQLARFDAWMRSQEKPLEGDKLKERWEYYQKATQYYEAEEPSKFEKWLDEKLGEKIFDILMVIVMIFSVVLSLGLFMYLPKLVVGWITPLTENRVIRSAAEGIMKMLIFVGYMAVTGCMKSIRRTYEYHGAEHKTIACLEAALPLTVENIRKQKRFHPRCGTSFIFLVLLISIFVGCLIPFTVVWQRVLCSIALLPLVVGISYELIRLAGRADNAFTRILSAPGLWIQRITTKEPDDKQIECAIAAITPCIPENIEDDLW